MAGGVDTSIYGQIRPVELPNMLGMAQTFANTQGAMQENEMRRRTIAAKQAFGQILQQNMKPDGTVDYENSAVMMAANPTTAWAAPEFIHDMAINKGLSVDNVAKKLELAFRQQDAIAQALAPLTAYGANVTPDQVKGVATQLYNSGILGGGQQGVQMLASVLGSLPQDGPSLSQAILNFSQRSKQTADTLHRTLGDMSAIDYGPGVSFNRISPLTGVNHVGDINKGVSPETASALTSIKSSPGQKDAQGNPLPAGTDIVMPRASVVGAPLVTQGMPGAVTTTGGAMGDLGAPGASPGGVGGSPGMAAPPPPTAPVGPPIAAGGSSAVAPPITGRVGPLSPQERDAAIAAKAGGVATTQLSGAVANPAPTTLAMRDAYVKEKALLQNSVTGGLSQLLQMKEALHMMGPDGAHTGGLAGWRTRVANVMYGLGMDKDFVDTVGNGNLSASEVINKISATNSFQTLHQLLGGQDHATNMFISMLHENLPNIETHPKAAREIYSMFARMYELQRQELKGMTLWEARGKPPEAFIPEGWVPWVNSPTGQKWINTLMRSTPEILQPESGKVVGATP